MDFKYIEYLDQLVLEEKFRAVEATELEPLSAYIFEFICRKGTSSHQKSSVLRATKVLLPKVALPAILEVVANHVDNQLIAAALDTFESFVVSDFLLTKELDQVLFHTKNRSLFVDDSVRYQYTKILVTTKNILELEFLAKQGYVDAIEGLGRVEHLEACDALESLLVVGGVIGESAKQALFVNRQLRVAEKGFQMLKSKQALSQDDIDELYRAEQFAIILKLVVANLVSATQRAWLIESLATSNDGKQKKIKKRLINYIKTLEQQGGY